MKFYLMKYSEEVIEDDIIRIHYIYNIDHKSGPLEIINTINIKECRFTILSSFMEMICALYKEDKISVYFRNMKYSYNNKNKTIYEYKMY